MRYLIIQNDRISPPGMVGERLAARHAEMAVVRPFAGDPLPESPHGFTGAIVLGGVMSAADDAGYPVMAPMRQLLREFHGAGRPVLGICLGAQILARCFGETVRRHSELEFGFVPLAITAEGRTDTLLAGLPNPQWLMQYHEDTFDMPKEAVPLMTGEACANQAFRVGRATYAFQCHFEATPELIAEWVEAGAERLPHYLGERTGAALGQLQRDSQQRAAAQRNFAETVTDRWLDLAQG